MAYGRRGGRGRHVDPYEQERAKKAAEREARAKARQRRLLAQFRKVRLTGDAAQAAWGLPELRRFDQYTILRGSKAKGLFLQEAGAIGWLFSKLVPRYQTPRESETETERDRTRDRSRRRSSVRSARDGAFEGWEVTYYEPTYGTRKFVDRSWVEHQKSLRWLNDGGYSYRVREIPKGEAASSRRQAFAGGIQRGRRERHSPRSRAS